MDAARYLWRVALLLMSAGVLGLSLVVAVFAAALFDAAWRRRLLRHIPAAPQSPGAPWLLGDMRDFGPMSPPFRTASHIAALAAASPHALVKYNF